MRNAHSINKATMFGILCTNAGKHMPDAYETVHFSKLWKNRIEEDNCSVEVGANFPFQNLSIKLNSPA